MLSTQKEKLQQKLGGYISIGITAGGVPCGVIGVPWESTAHAFNMRTPDVYIAPEDLQDGDIMAQLDTCKVIGCYIWEPLTDYGFLTRFRHIEDLNIYNGEAIRDLDFLEGLPQCRMLYLGNAVLQDLNTLVCVKKNNPCGFWALRCIALCNCYVADLSVFEREEVSFSEFLVWNPKDRDERQRWQVVDALTRRYYELK